MTTSLVAAGERHVRTPEGAALYDQPIGAVITKDVIEAAKRAAEAVPSAQAAEAEAARAVRPGPRDSIRRRIRAWFETPDMTPQTQEIVSGFDPRTFESDGQAGQYALNHSSPGRFGHIPRSPAWSSESHESISSDSLSGFHEAQAELRKGEVSSPRAKAFIAKFNRHSSPTTDDLIVSRRVGLDAFPGGSVEGLGGKEIHDAAYFQGNLGTPIGDAPVLLTVAVPKGTRAMFTGNGPNDRGVILDRDQGMQVTKVIPDGKGGWYVAAVAAPSRGRASEALKEEREIPTGAPARRGGPGAPPLLEREPGRRAPGFAQPRAFDEPETRAAPPPQHPRLRVAPPAESEPTAIRQVRKLPDEIAAELNNPKTTIARMREIAKEYDLKVPGAVTRKGDVRDFLLGRRAEEAPSVETRKLSAEATAQLAEPKTTVAQLRKIAKDHGVRIPSTETRKEDIRKFLMRAGGIKEKPPDLLPPSERDRFREAWREVGKAPSGPAQRELNEVFIDVRGGRLGVLDAARRLENSAGIDREERNRLRARRGDGEPGAEERKLDDEIAAKEKAAKFLRDYRLAEETPAPAPVKKVAKKAAPKKTATRIDDHIRMAYSVIRARRGDRKWVSLADLREEMGEQYSRGEVDKALKDLVGKPGVHLESEMNQSALTHRDRDAAVYVGGDFNHYISIAASFPTAAPGPVVPPAAPKKATSSAGTPRATPRLSRDELEKYNKGQLEVMARHRGIHIPTGATKEEIIDALTSGRTNPMAGPATITTETVPESTLDIRPELAQATGHRTLARATQDEYRRITGRELAIDFGSDPDLSLQTSKEHMEGILRAAQQWPETDLREVRWFNGDIGGPWAIGGNNAIMFNSAYTSKTGRDRYLQELAAGVAGWESGGVGFHPRGASTPAAAAMHEFGHLIEGDSSRPHLGTMRLVARRTQEENERRPSRLIAREVSQYATMDAHELVAEAFLDVMLNGDAAGRLSREIVDLFRGR